jgi:hypothetical protein
LGFSIAEWSLAIELAVSFALFLAAFFIGEHIARRRARSSADLEFIVALSQNVRRALHTYDLINYVDSATSIPGKTQEVEWIKKAVSSLDPEALHERARLRIAHHSSAQRYKPLLKIADICSSLELMISLDFSILQSGVFKTNASIYWNYYNELLALADQFTETLQKVDRRVAREMIDRARHPVLKHLVRVEVEPGTKL